MVLKSKGLVWKKAGILLCQKCGNSVHGGWGVVVFNLSHVLLLAFECGLQAGMRVSCYIETWLQLVPFVYHLCYVVKIPLWLIFHHCTCAEDGYLHTWYSLADLWSFNIMRDWTIITVIHSWHTHSLQSNCHFIHSMLQYNGAALQLLLSRMS